MAVKVFVDRGKIAVKINTLWKDNLATLSEEILNDTNQYCKEDTGTLIASSLVHSLPEQGKLIWQTPYARRQYWEIRTAYTDVNPKATWKWFEAAKRANMAKWEKQANALMGANK